VICIVHFQQISSLTSRVPVLEVLVLITLNNHQHVVCDVGIMKFPVSDDFDIGDKVYRLNEAIYGLKQTSRMWYSQSMKFCADLISKLVMQIHVYIATK